MSYEEGTSPQVRCSLVKVTTDGRPTAELLSGHTRRVITEGARALLARVQLVDFPAGEHFQFRVYSISSHSGMRKLQERDIGKAIEMQGDVEYDCVSQCLWLAVTMNQSELGGFPVALWHRPVYVGKQDKKRHPHRLLLETNKQKVPVLSIVRASRAKKVNWHAAYACLLH